MTFEDFENQYPRKKIKPNRTQKNDEFIITCKESQSKEVYKNNIISAMYLHPLLREKILAMIDRYNAPALRNYVDDCINEVMVMILEKSAEEIIEMYEDNPIRLLKLFVTISYRRIFSSKNTSAPSASFSHKIKLYSNVFLNSDKDKMDYMLDNLVDKQNYQGDYYDDVYDTLTSEDEVLLSRLNNKNIGSFAKYFWSIDLSTKEQYSKLIIRIENHQKKNKIINMEKEKFIELIEKNIRPILITLFSSQVGHLTNNDKLELKNIWDNYYNPAVRIDMSCANCIKDAICLFVSMYERKSTNGEMKANIKKIKSKIDENVRNNVAFDFGDLIDSFLFPAEHDQIVESKPANKKKTTRRR